MVVGRRAGGGRGGATGAQGRRPYGGPQGAAGQERAGGVQPTLHGQGGLHAAAAAAAVEALALGLPAPGAIQRQVPAPGTIDRAGKHFDCGLKEAGLAHTSSAWGAQPAALYPGACAVPAPGTAQGQSGSSRSAIVHKRHSGARGWVQKLCKAHNGQLLPFARCSCGGFESLWPAAHSGPQPGNTLFKGSAQPTCTNAGCVRCVQSHKQVALATLATHTTWVQPWQPPAQRG